MPGHYLQLCSTRAGQRGDQAAGGAVVGAVVEGWAVYAEELHGRGDGVPGGGGPGGGGACSSSRCSCAW